MVYLQVLGLLQDLFPVAVPKNPRVRCKRHPIKIPEPPQLTIHCRGATTLLRDLPKEASPHPLSKPETGHP